MSSSRPYLSTLETTQSKASSVSNEADDERSWGSPPMSTNGARTVARYAGEDIRQTSEKELRGFYAYSWASEVFVICGMGSFIPITLEQIARERGVLSTDHTTPCVSATSNSTSVRSTPSDAPQCVLPILGTEINTASFAMYTFSVSVFIQFLLIISMSGAADHGSYRKTLLIIFALTGAIATTLFLPIEPHTVILAAIFAIIANTCYGASSVLLNSFLPLLVRNHPDLQHKLISENGTYGTISEAVTPDNLSNHEETTDNLNASLLGHRLKTSHGLDSDIASPELSISTKISSFGIGIGYISALLVQTVAIYIVWSTKRTGLSLRIVLFVIGIWWIVFTIPAALWLRPRPGPPLRLSHSTSKFWTLIAYTRYSWKSLGKSMMRARKLKDVLLFLAAWFLLSDAIATVSGTAVLFAKTSLEMKPAALAMITVVVTLAGIVGAFCWPRISNMMGLKPSHTVLLCIALFELIPLYGLLGYLPIFKRWGVGGLQQGWEMYPVAVVYGFVLGGFSSFCRALFGELVPPGFEAAFYALYAITDKGSSVFGPAIVGAITDATGEIRPAFFFLACLIATPFPILLFVDVERGNREGIALAKELEVKGYGVSDEDSEGLLGHGDRGEEGV